MEEAYRRYLAMLGPGVNAMDLQTFAVSGTMQLFLEYERRSIINERAMSSELFSRFRASYNATGGISFDEAWKKASRQRKARRKAVPKAKPPSPQAPSPLVQQEPSRPIDVAPENPLRKYRSSKWF